MEIVLDKSYLIGKSGQRISELCDSKIVLMTEALFYELLTTTPKERAECFGKFPDIDSPVKMTTNSGALMRAECLNKRPCNLIEDSGLNQPFKFHNGMKDENFVMADNYQKILSEWKSFISDEVRSFKVIAGLVAGFFPELKVLRAGSSKKAIQSALDEISGESQKVLEIYEHIRDKRIFPPASAISNRWIMYRHLQANLAAAIEYIRKYGSGTIDAQSNKIENDVMDIEYCIMACVTNNLASRDTGLINMYKIINPNGFVLS